MERKGVIRASSASLLPLVCLMLLLAFVTALKGEEASQLTPAMFIFGDSLNDNGNNNYLPTVARANYMPYGIDLGTPTGRFCNGLLVVDYGARLLGLPLIPPYLSPTSKATNMLNGINYASAAAGILDETGRHYGGRTSFNGQILLFEKTVKMQLPPLFEAQEALITGYLAKSVFIINIGSNDYINNYLLPSIYSTSQTFRGEAFADLLVATLSQQISKLYNLGARKMVLVGIGPLGCIPSQLSMANSRDSTCVEWVNNLVCLFNDRLVQLSDTLNSSLPGSFFVYQNIFTAFSDIIKSPSNYGFSVSNQACCGNGRFGGALTCLPFQLTCSNRDEYIFWDSFHPTQAVNKIIADRCYSAFARDCYPISIHQLAKI